MITRVTSSTVNASLSRQIDSQYANFAKITQQIASGKKINSILDDPVQAINLVSSNRQLNKIGIWTGNISAISNEVKQSSDTIELMIDKAQRAKDLALNASSGTSTKNTLQSTLSELDQIIYGFVDMANTNYNGSYIYAGANTKTPPYEVEYGIDEDGNKTKEIIGVKYTGTALTGEWERKLEIASGVFERINVTGIEAFGDYDKEPILDADGKPVLDEDGNPTYQVNSQSGIFSNLIEFRNSLKTTIEKLEIQENLPKTATEEEKKAAAEAVKAGYDSINGVIDGITNSMQIMTVVNTRFGTLSNKLDMASETLASTESNLTEHISGIQDIDMAAAASEWYKSQYAYQASMQASTSIMSMSLLNYI